MESMRRAYRNSKSSADMKRTVREIKNKLYNYSEMEQMTREATCNDAAEPQHSLMRELAKGTFTVEFSAIMAILWRRMQEKKNERHPLKCLIVLEFLLHEGNIELVMQQCKNNMHHLQALTTWRLINDSHIDVAMPVRERAKKILAFLRDEPVPDDGGRSAAAAPPRQQQPASAPDEQWKSGFRWDAEDGPDLSRAGGGGGGGKFQIQIKPAAGGGGGAPPSARDSAPNLLGDSLRDETPFAAPADDPFASPADDPFASPADDPFASSSAAAPPPPLAAVGAFDPFGAPPTSLLESPAAANTQDELMSLALPNDPMASLGAPNLAGQNDMALLGAVDLASPTGGGGNFFGSPDDFGAAAAAAAHPAADDPVDSLVNFDNINLTKAEAVAKASPAPVATKPKTMAEMAKANPPSSSPAAFASPPMQQPPQMSTAGMPPAAGFGMGMLQQPMGQPPMGGMAVRPMGMGSPGFGSPQQQMPPVGGTPQPMMGGMPPQPMMGGGMRPQYGGGLSSPPPQMPSGPPRTGMGAPPPGSGFGF